MAGRAGNIMANVMWRDGIGRVPVVIGSRQSVRHYLDSRRVLARPELILLTTSQEILAGKTECRTVPLDSPSPVRHPLHCGVKVRVRVRNRGIVQGERSRGGQLPVFGEDRLQNNIFCVESHVKP